ncbi:MAG: A/G-specific adenine glycosylase [Planctomycetes bacterium]|nr:A/G-specific adenine glycosylase [Planctomycetota bacterium]
MECAPAPATAIGSAQAELLRWYRTTGRDLPWRHTRDPYRILVSETMLQQTQVDRVVPFFERFIAAFPDERTFAAADQETIHRMWKGLGYPSRVERLQAACRQVIAGGGIWPSTPDALRELPGIGPYTAGAVACFAFGAAVPIVDTNVARVYARRDALPLPLDRTAVWPHVAPQVDRADPIAYNNALMDLGALVCTAKKPACDRCPWRHRCASRDDLAVHAATSNPLKVASPKVAYGVAITDRSKVRQHIVLGLIHHEGRYLVAKRPATVHQGSCWELPGGKRDVGEDDRSALARELAEELGAELLSARALVRFSHAYDDRYLTFHCYRCRVFNPLDLKPLASDGLRWVLPEEFVALPFPPANQPLIERMRRYHRLA